jgi:pimeloyl-ACP methyl ester carboxylesterase
MSMQRPIMNPTFLEDHTPLRRRKFWARLAPLFRVAKAVGRVMLWNPLRGRTQFRVRIEDGTPWQRFCRGLLYRLTFLPVLTALAVVVLVYTGTHPHCQVADIDPSSQGIYYEAVTLRTDDGVRLEAWLVPVLEAEQVLREKELALRTKEPAVLLVHDFGQDRLQMLPLIRPLHEAGFVVMALSLRGCGSSASSGSTFGLLESSDVRAAIDVLRKRSFVDPKRIAVVGVGMGANAALLAAANDPSLRAMVLDHPSVSGNEILVNHIVPKYHALDWMLPMCKWAFELSYQVHTDDLDMSQYASLMSSRKVLMFDGSAPIADFTPHNASNICRFLSASLMPDDAAHAALCK